MAYSFYLGSLSVAPYCAVAFRVCAIPTCLKWFAVSPKLRRKYCSDLCSATAIIARHSNKVSSVPQALSVLERDRRGRVMRKAFHKGDDLAQPPAPKGETWKRPIENKHQPGSIAFMLLYGDSRPTFSTGTEPARVGRGGGRSAVQIGGPSL